MSSNCDFSEARSSVLDSEIQDKCLPEELFAKIIKSLEEYTTEKAEILLLNKTKILKTLKTHRPVKITDYQYGLSLTLRKNYRLIVFEWNDRRMVREYSLHSRGRVIFYTCRECFRLHNRRQLHSADSFVYLINGIIFVPIVHNCPPRDYKLTMQYQKFLEEGNTVRARGMARAISFAFEENSFMNVVNVVTDAALLRRHSSSIKEIDDNIIVAKTSANLKRKLNDNEKLSVNKRLKHKGTFEEPSTSRINDENDILITEDSQIHKQIKAKNGMEISNEPHPLNIQKCEITVIDTTTPISATTYSFVKPSISKLQKICSKLEIKFCKEAMKFWKEIVFKEINPSSTNIITQNYKEKNFYKILSNFFTGKFSNYEQIYLTINTALRDKLIVDGKMSFEDIDLLCSSYTVTQTHLKFIAKFLPCRILIFDKNENEVKKYGKWKDTENINVLTLVLSLSKRKYSVVLNL